MQKFKAKDLWCINRETSTRLTLNVWPRFCNCCIRTRTATPQLSRRLGFLSWFTHHVPCTKLYLLLLRHVLKQVTTHQDHIKTLPKFPKTTPRLNFSRRNHSPHPFGPQRSAWWFAIKVSDSSTSHASPTLVEPGTSTVHHYIRWAQIIKLIPEMDFPPSN